MCVKQDSHLILGD